MRKPQQDRPWFRATSHPSPLLPSGHWQLDFRHAAPLPYDAGRYPHHLAAASGLRYDQTEG